MLGILFSGVLGAVLSGMILFFLTEHNKRRQIIREKGEQTFVLLNEVLDILNDVCHAYHVGSLKKVNRYEGDNCEEIYMADIEDISRKMQYAKLLIIAYFNNLELFNRAYDFLFAINGFYCYSFSFSLEGKSPFKGMLDIEADQKRETLNQLLYPLSQASMAINEVQKELLKHVEVPDITIEGALTKAKNTISYWWSFIINKIKK